MQNIIHGDCLSELAKLPDRSVDLVLTDAPYGDNCGYGRHKRMISGNEHPLVGLMALAESYRLLRCDRNAYFFLDIKHLPIVRTFVEQYTSFAIKDWLVWDKVAIGMGRGFRKRHELILVLEKGKPVYRNLGIANVLTVKRAPAREHPHEKPVSLLHALIRQSTDEGGIVLDPFLGSGSTAVAALALRRGIIGIECEARYIAVCRDRVAHVAAL